MKFVDRIDEAARLKDALVREFVFFSQPQNIIVKLQGIQHSQVDSDCYCRYTFLEFNFRLNDKGELYRIK